jgi:hypothetical protein
MKEVLVYVNKIEMPYFVWIRLLGLAGYTAAGGRG